MWGDTIVDGHNRYEICHRHNIPFDFHVLKFPLPEDAIAWIINNQLARRNLTPEQRAYLIGKQYLERKLTPAEAGSMKGKSYGQNVHSKTTAEAIAETSKVDEKTVSRNAAFAQAVDTIAGNVGEEARQKILGRETKLTAKDIHRVAAMEPEKQKEVLDKVFTGAAPALSMPPAYSAKKRSKKPRP